MTNVSWYRRSVWQYKGSREYTKIGYTTAKERFVAEDLEIDCSDRHYVITGCNSGIGFEIAREVAKRGGVLHMVCRNFESAKKARADLITGTGNDKIHLHTLDLAKPREVATWAKEFAANHEKIHVLINNAGCMVHERNLDEDGIETNFAVNTLAVHIITMAFLPILQKNEDARVVTVSSAGMLVVRLDPLDLMHETMEPFNGRLVYSQNKRQQVVMTLWYAQRYDNVHFSVMHPGWADTPAVRNSMPEFYEQMKDTLRTASEGADTAVWLAISRAAVKLPSGFFFQDRAPASTHLPLAWTKTSIEEENLLMQKLMVLTQKVNGELPEADAKAIANETAANISHSLSNGSSEGTSISTSSKVEELSATLSAVSIPASTETDFLKKVDDDVVDTRTEKPLQEIKVATLCVEEQTLPNETVEKPSTPPFLESNKEKEKQCQSESDLPKQAADPQTSIAETKDKIQPSNPTTETKRAIVTPCKEEQTLPNENVEKQSPLPLLESKQEEKPCQEESDLLKQESVSQPSLAEAKDKTGLITITAEIATAIVPEPATVEIHGEPVTEELISIANETPEKVPQEISGDPASPDFEDVIPPITETKLLEVTEKVDEKTAPIVPTKLSDVTLQSPPEENEQLLNEKEEKPDSIFS